MKDAQEKLDVANKADDTKGAQYWQQIINANNAILDLMGDQNFQATLSAENQEKINRILQERVLLQNKAQLKGESQEEKDELATIRKVENAVKDLSVAYKNLKDAQTRKDGGSA